MEYSTKTEALERLSTDCLVLGVFQKRKLAPSTEILDTMFDGLLAKLLKRDDVEGKAGDTLLINHVPGGRIERVLLVGLGKKDELDVAAYRKSLDAAFKALKGCGAKHAVSVLHEVEVGGSCAAWKVRQAVELTEAALYRFQEMKGDTSENHSPRLSRLQFLAASESEVPLVEAGIREGEAIARGVTLARNLGNLPGNVCTPAYLAEQALKIGKEHKKLKVSVLEESDMDELGMGSLLSVARGSRQPAKLIVMEYRGGGGKAKPHVLVGKGLTFDAGGISLKPAANMDEMKYDMCGGASVIGAIQAVAELGLPLNVVGLVPASENLPDGNANKPGDIVKSMAGITIEILNTDAEGRLILCDTLTYAKRFDPAAVIDVATLTGACIVALGRHPSGLMGNDDALCEQLVRAGDTAWDRVWRMPIWDDYQEQLKSNFADLGNIGGPDGGSITAACFLSRFAKDFHWAHLDIAGTAWKTGADKGATGRPVALLVQYLIDRAV
ncbi:MAG: leucyl aminopeptidase [Methylococcus sp.]|nr:leucyl aminopeptidase [Methylococcus sp.]